ncbi:threonine ammonia-lyase IlvA [Fulvivirga sedimenti]|uniref:L-threonine dehydratase n=1 Tax=Fulvivirga sedimenti TaxID=2879465 RepID=A0A9X1HPB5_9BACT|nr:threonine ammonia-lyase IlvA [Fulvivirga sedimenti]MCA6075465.1 threonine ammonia-lyase IlvA [Fulvivirga sedimenti]MCA6076642.1 threonine ammonia-lyase IlvA [Fulvivirga sedimenti]MCA6077770.1 threonine ammonia-lyase IlvA [Fulvivirga sedimenti]
MENITTQTVTVNGILTASEVLKDVIVRTPLLRHEGLSEKLDANILLKREDLQVVRSYKIRGAYNKIHNTNPGKLDNGIVCASAGNHAQGVALACRKKQIQGRIYMPVPTPDQKVKQVTFFGREFVEVVLTGDTFDDAYHEARKYGEEHGAEFIHPFDDPLIIEGQGTVGKEILEDSEYPIDYLIVPIGGGGLAAGVSTYIKSLSPNTRIIGVEPAGAPAMKKSLEKDELVTLDRIDKFVDGAAVKRVGEMTFQICRELIDEVITVPEGKVCSEILRLYNEDAIVVEPAGALTIAALDMLAERIRGKNVVAVVSGSNNDITRTSEIKERSMLFEGLKHYFIINFPQRAGALREFLIDVLGPNDDISHFEYYKKNNREKGPALIGIELKNHADLEGLIDRMDEKKIRYEYVNDQPHLFHYLI